MRKPTDIFALCTGFQWDYGNEVKNWDKHEVTQQECEQVFCNEPLIVLHDQEHSKAERRYLALGRTDAYRLLFVVFTIRSGQIRVISARDVSRKERQRYLI